jgi:hypothetical protein
MYFDVGKGMGARGLIKLIHNPVERAKWDKDVEYGKILGLSENGKLLLFHQRMKSAISFIQKRDFLEKKLKFKVKVPPTQEGGRERTRHFIFFTSIPDDHMPSEKNVTRA